MKELLEELYIDKQMSIAGIGQQLHRSSSFILKKMREFNIPRRTIDEATKIACKQGRRRYFDTSKSELEELYLGEKLSTRQIAEKLDVSKSEIKNKLRQYNIPRRTASQALILAVSYSKSPFYQKGASHPSWRGGRYKSKSGYIFVKCPEHPYANSNGYVLEHRLVVEQQLGRLLTKNETVHHRGIRYKDIRNRADNLKDNLGLRTGQHGNGIILVCADCGSHNIQPVKGEKDGN